MPNDMTVLFRVCPANGCKAHLDHNHLVFCPRHWDALPETWKTNFYKSRHRPDKYNRDLLIAQAARFLAEQEPKSGAPEFDTDQFVSRVAAMAYAVHRAYCEEMGNYLGPWAETSELQRTPWINSVRFMIAHPQAKASDHHESWMAAQRAAGWTFGPRLDPEGKHNPRMVPYHLLPLEERVRDGATRAAVHAAVEQFGPNR